METCSTCDFVANQKHLENKILYLPGAGCQGGRQGSYEPKMSNASQGFLNANVWD